MIISNNLILLTSIGLVSLFINMVAIKSVKCQKRVSRRRFAILFAIFFSGVIALLIAIFYGIDERIIFSFGLFHIVIIGGLLSKRLLGRLNDAGVRKTVVFAYFAAIPLLGFPILLFLSIKGPSFPNFKLKNS
tara:strand:+ start:816 stop:1214 length:399 start_codon:yes stop_codon:yes gene_type:complete